ncbi:DNA internalization-related competence protein ComEC/Rec2 [Pseudomaricurvus sp. HS19]|uniref:DNA internalization-related competence protein ComEC/Rec2 n=1 Tax=Pseudomaricurvus sp. HS19 TaxID=2692626 RepID=UPI00136C7FAC|nr:DNA internalization-related competence protein ComEC/Rec2 [Pseudomaricurvus sp. HS19]MYM62701.1 DNA internalization-related competence protein ComEC/Rec2 [Pseudomaricurvus sp. HS19]
MWFLWVWIACVSAFAVVAWLPSLPSLSAISVAASAVFSFALFSLWLLPAYRRVTWSLLLPLLALLWAMGWGAWQLQWRLPAALEGEDLLVRGVVVTPVKRVGILQRFEFRVQEVRRAGESAGEPLLPLESGIHFPRRLRLTSYEREPRIGYGDGWQFVVRLKQPHGYASAGAFDFERWLFSRGIGAGGYVRWGSDGLSRRVASLDRGTLQWRQQLTDVLAAELPPGMAAAMVQALALGDRSAFDAQQRELLQRAGLSHLVAISGLHIGLAATLGFLIGRWLGALLSLRWPLSVFGPRWGVLGGCVVALAYAWVAGFSLSAQRALIMLLVAALWWFALRRYSSWLGVGIAMLLVLVLQPLAILEAGFWFSFIAVLVLLLFARGRHRGVLSKLWLLARLQVALFVVMTVLQGFWGMPVSVLSPLVNLLAIPFVSLLVVPLVLLALAIAPLDLAWSLPVWQLAVWLCQGLVWVLEWLQPWLAATLLALAGVPSVAGVWLAAVAALLLLLPLSWPSRLLATLVVLAVGLARPQSAPPRLEVLDVGQGLAVMVSDGSQHLLYDTGPAFGDFSAVESVVLPWLGLQRATGLQQAVISHWDNDHAGGLGPLQRGVAVEGWLLAPGRRAHAPVHGTLQWCDRDREWWLGGWLVRAFGVTAGSGGSDNNRSCVLLLEYDGLRVLLPGDIEKEREAQLLRHPWLQQPVSIMVAPHHGSKSSSSVGWLQQLQPQVVLVSSGYRNRYHHPHPSVLRRYQALGSRVYSTAEEGSLTVEVIAGGGYNVSGFRLVNRRYWHWLAAGEVSAAGK